MKERFRRWLALLDKLESSSEGMESKDLIEALKLDGFNPPKRTLYRDLEDLMEIGVVSATPGSATYPRRYSVDATEGGLRTLRGHVAPHVALASLIALEHASQLLPASITKELCNAQERLRSTLSRRNGFDASWVEKLAIRPLGLKMKGNPPAR